MCERPCLNGILLFITVLFCSLEPMGATYSVRIQFKYNNVDSIMKLTCHRSDLNERLSTSVIETRK